MGQLFAQGKIAMFVSGRWSVPAFRQKLTFKWDIRPFPKGPAGSIGQPAPNADVRTSPALPPAHHSGGAEANRGPFSGGPAKQNPARCGIPAGSLQGQSRPTEWWTHLDEVQST